MFAAKGVYTSRILIQKKKIKNTSSMFYLGSAYHSQILLNVVKSLNVQSKESHQDVSDRWQPGVPSQSY